MKLFHMTFAASALALAACTPAGDAGEDTATETAAEDTRMTEVLAHERRAEDMARDEARNPAETLAFFQLAPNQTVLEYAPGGGWYTRVLAPYASESGQYIGVSFAPEGIESLPEDFRAQMRAGGESFSADQGEALGIDAAKLPFHFGDAMPAELDGTVDRVLIFRMMHNLMRWGNAESEIAALRKTMKPNGLLGVVQHRAKADASDEYADGNMGYLREADVIAFFEANGFELVEKSEINANEKDTADYEGGVWTLPPSLATGADEEKYNAIGESDRMTLLFKLAE